jgi:hypothetical protein
MGSSASLREGRCDGLTPGSLLPVVFYILTFGGRSAPAQCVSAWISMSGLSACGLLALSPNSKPSKSPHASELGLIVTQLGPLVSISVDPLGLERCIRCTIGATRSFPSLAPRSLRLPLAVLFSASSSFPWSHRTSTCASAMCKCEFSLLVFMYVASKRVASALSHLRL